MPKETKHQKAGRLCEEAKKIEYQGRGYLVETTGRGSDFVAVKPGSKPILVEVKNCKGGLSKLQNETRKRAVSNGFDYRVERCGCKVNDE